MYSLLIIRPLLYGRRCSGCRGSALSLFGSLLLRLLSIILNIRNGKAKSHDKVLRKPLRELRALLRLFR
jgi:hypothetical protein